MRYLTREWALGKLPDEEIENARAAYWQHVTSIMARLSEPIAVLAQTVRLHDGLIRRVIVDRKARQLVFELCCGDLENGYYDTNLAYAGVRFDQIDLDALAALARDPRTELLNDEVDIEENGDYVHRILFWPSGEIVIVFSALKIEQTRQPNRFVPHAKEPYQDLTQNAELHSADLRQPS